MTNSNQKKPSKLAQMAESNPVAAMVKSDIEKESKAEEKTFAVNLRINKELKRFMTEQAIVADENKHLECYGSTGNGTGEFRALANFMMALSKETGVKDVREMILRLVESNREMEKKNGVGFVDISLIDNEEVS